MNLFVVFFRHESIRHTSNHEMLFQISPPETIHNEVDGVCHILSFRFCLTFIRREREREREIKHYKRSYDYAFDLSHRGEALSDLNDKRHFNIFNPQHFAPPPPPPLLPDSRPLKTDLHFCCSIIQGYISKEKSI